MATKQQTAEQLITRMVDAAPDGKVPIVDILQAGAELGLSRDAIGRARRRLGIESHRLTYGGEYMAGRPEAFSVKVPEDHVPTRNPRADAAPLPARVADALPPAPLEPQPGDIGPNFAACSPNQQIALLAYRAHRKNWADACNQIGIPAHTIHNWRSSPVNGTTFVAAEREVCDSLVSLAESTFFKLGLGELTTWKVVKGEVIEDFPIPPNPKVLHTILAANLPEYRQDGPAGGDGPMVHTSLFTMILNGDSDARAAMERMQQALAPDTDPGTAQRLAQESAESARLARQRAIEASATDTTDDELVYQ